MIAKILGYKSKPEIEQETRDEPTAGMFQISPTPMTGAFFHRRQRRSYSNKKFTGKKLRYV